MFAIQNGVFPWNPALASPIPEGRLVAFTNVLVEIHLGNVESRLYAPGAALPRQLLDRELNPHLPGSAADEVFMTGTGGATVFDPCRDAVLNGALVKAKHLLRGRGYRIRVREARSQAAVRDRWTLQPGHVLRAYQEEVVERALRLGHGLIDIGTGGGKTLLAAAVIARLSLPTLYLVTTRTLLAQSIAALRSYLGIEPGVIGDGRREPATLTVALVQSLEADRVELDPWRGGALIFDEGHHAAAASYLDVIRRADPRFHFYLSAVPVRSGQDQAVLDALAGGSLTGGKYSAQFLIEKGYAAPVETRFMRCRIEADMTEQPFGDLYRRFIVDNEQRNALIAEVAQAESGRGRSVLLLVDHVRHGHALRALVGPGAAFLHGGTPRSELRDLTACFSRGSLKCLIATSGLFQEGVSIDGIHVLIQAGGLKSRVKVLQAVGRGMRRAPGKDACLYVDFFDDDTAGIFRAHARQRMRVLKEEGFAVSPIERTRPPAPEDSELAPSWAHVAGTNRFVFVDSEGRVRIKARCVEQRLVPAKYCKRCSEPWCREGGKVTWRDEQG